jgi:hypothetical protein
VRWYANCNALWGDIMTYNGPGAYYCTVADSHPRENYSVRADPNIVFDNDRIQNVFVVPCHFESVSLTGDRNMRRDQHAIANGHAPRAPDVDKFADACEFSDTNRSGRADHDMPTNSRAGAQRS